MKQELQMKNRVAFTPLTAKHSPVDDAVLFVTLREANEAIAQDKELLDSTVFLYRAELESKEVALAWANKQLEAAKLQLQALKDIVNDVTWALRDRNEE